MVISFLGTKGGTGTTTLAVNCAAELRRVSGRPAVIVDLKSGTGDVGLFLGLRPKFTLLDLLDQLDWIDPPSVPSLLARHECGIDVLPAAADFARPGSADVPNVEHAIDTLRRAYDYVAIDVGSTLGPCSAAALLMSDEVHLVANPDVPCLRNLQRLRDLVRLAGVSEDRVRYVLNRTSDLEVVPLREIEEALGRHIDHRFTSDYRSVVAALNAGVPLSALRPCALRSELDIFARALVARAVPAV
ncbi:MAG TPA: AAA family ATPase [Vicinamibacterales bacterium]|nr:AAA family ATPase [Vicinamibacterales bacterium]